MDARTRALKCARTLRSRALASRVFQFALHCTPEPATQATLTQYSLKCILKHLVISVNKTVTLIKPKTNLPCNEQKATKIN